ncbi:FUSC family protein [Peterkaempfera griseoplana]|uniref:FUSC family protein n=1 Tax=Peterkaempfera griseoplana TaxID=66896 RepID=UPI0006E1C12D|nr:FUSC family protein [Peterkaempfera griseoplana]
MGRRARQAWTALWDRFTASDPGLIRLLAACNTVGAMLLLLAVLAAVHTPVPLLVVGAVTTLACSFAAGEPRLRDQAVTQALGLPTALLSVALASALVSHRVAADVVFVALIFIAVYVRRYGQRGTGLGIIAFQLFFVSQFVQAGPAALPQVCAVVATAFAAGAVVRFGVVRATPERTLRRLQHAFRVRLGRVLDAQAEAAAQGARAPLPDRTGVELSRSTARLHECALMIQSRLEAGTPDAATAGLVQRRVAEAEIAAERQGILLLRALQQGPGGRRDYTLDMHLLSRGPTGPAARPTGADSHPPYVPAPPDATALRTLERELRALRLLVGRPPAQRRGTGYAVVRNRLLGYRDDHRLPQASPAVRDAFRAVGELARAMLGLHVALDREGDSADDSPETARSREELEAEDASLAAVEQEEPADEPGTRGLRRPSTRAACQVAVGSALAILGGELLSPQRWYWAVLTCWVVFINTSSTGEILIKGYRRLIGTVVGVVAGLALAVPVGGDPRLAFALVIVCIFGMTFTAPLSYTLMSFFVTMMLGLLYTLLHTFSTEVLVLRIEETALGAASGLIAAVLVLPVATGSRTDEQLAQVLRRLDEVFAAAVCRLSGTGVPPGTEPAGDLLTAARALDTALDGLRRAVGPLTHPVSPLRARRRTARYVVGLLETCAYHVRSLAAVAEQLPQGQLTESLRIGTDPRLTGASQRIRGNLRTLLRRVEGCRERPALETGPNIAALLGDRAEGSVALRVLRHLQRLDEAVLGLGRPLGLATVSGGETRRDPQQDVPV